MACTADGTQLSKVAECLPVSGMAVGVVPPPSQSALLPYWQQVSGRSRRQADRIVRPNHEARGMPPTVRTRHENPAGTLR
jgi:hypothetical protein